MHARTLGCRLCRAAALLQRPALALRISGSWAHRWQCLSPPLPLPLGARAAGLTRLELSYCGEEGLYSIPTNLS